MGIYKRWGYTKELPSIKSQGPLITWSCKFAWQIRSVISLLPQGLWPPNLVRWWLSTRSFHLESPAILWTRYHAWSHDKTYYISTTAMTMATKGVGWSSLDHIIFQFHVTNYVVSTIIKPLAIKRDKVITCYHGFPPIKSRNAWDTWSFEIM